MGVGLEREPQREPATPELLGLRTGDHVFFPYAAHAENDAAVVAFVREGLLRGERCAYAAQGNHLTRAAAGLRAAGIDIERAIQRRALWMIPVERAYQQGGSFDVERTIAFLGTQIDRAVSDGFAGLRGAGEFDFSLTEPNHEGAHRYECRLNNAFVGRPFTALCAYARGHVPDRLAADMLGVHPLALVDGRRVRNPFFASPPAVSTRPTKAFLDVLLEGVVAADAAATHQRRLLTALIAETATEKTPPHAEAHARRSPAQWAPLRAELQALRRELRDNVSPPATQLLIRIERIWSEARRIAPLSDAPEDPESDQPSPGLG